MHLQEVSIKAFKEHDWEDDLQIVIQNYGVNEFDVPSFSQFLPFLTEKLYGLDSRMHLSEMIALFKKLDTIKRMLAAEVIKLVKLILIMPAINAVSERSFWFLKIIKTYLCLTANNWLNHLLILHIHKLLTDRLDLMKVVTSLLKEETKENQNLDFVNVRHYLF